MCDKSSSYLILVDFSVTLETSEGDVQCELLTDSITVFSHGIVEGSLVLKHCYLKKKKNPRTIKYLLRDLFNL